MKNENVRLIGQFTSYNGEELHSNEDGYIYDWEGYKLCKDDYEKTITFIKKRIEEEKKWEYERGQENIRRALKMLIGIEVENLNGRGGV